MAKEELTIVSDRLELVSMTPEFLEACLAGDPEAASGLLGLEVHEDWLRERGLMRLRLDQMRRNPALEQWLLRAICLRRQGTMIGHIGFHDQPGNDDLRDLAPGGAEFGYSIFPPFRRRGYATEACGALMDWASREHHVPRFVVSISPENLPSLRIASRFGFRKVGSHVDEEDGPEDILVLDVAETIRGDYGRPGKQITKAGPQDELRRRSPQIKGLEITCTPEFIRSSSGSARNEAPAALCWRLEPSRPTRVCCS